MDKDFTNLRFIVTAVSYAVAKTGKSYACLMLSSVKDNISVNVWNAPEGTFKIKTIVVFTHLKVSSDGFMSTNISDVIFYEPDTIKDSDLLEFFPKVPGIYDFHKLVDSVKSHLSPNYYEALNVAIDKYVPSYMRCPAARTNHHAYPGGLSVHTFQIMRMACSLFEGFPFKFNLGQVLLAGLFHDFGKCAEYDTDNGNALTEHFFLQGHPFIGANELVEFLKTFDLKFTPRERELMSHAVLAHHGRLEWGAPVLPATMEAFILAHLDNLSGWGDTYEKSSNLQSQRTLNVSVIKS